MAEYAFKHPLTQEVAYGSQLEERRARVHAAVAGAIEALHRRAARRARRAARAPLRGRGRGARRGALGPRAAERMGQSHPGEALRLWRKVRSLLREVPRSPETARLGARACSQVLNHGITQGLSDEEAAEIFEEGKALAELAGDPAQHAFLIYRYGIFRGVLGGAIEEWIDLSTRGAASCGTGRRRRGGVLREDGAGAGS